MGFFKEQLISKDELETIVESNRHRFDSATKNETEALYYPGRPVKLCVIEKGIVSWIPGVILIMTGNAGSCQMQVALSVGENFFTSIELDNTCSVSFNFEG